MADRGKIESPNGDARAGKKRGAESADLKAVAAGLSALPGPVDFAGVLAIADSSSRADRRPAGSAVTERIGSEEREISLDLPVGDRRVPLAELQSGCSLAVMMVSMFAVMGNPSLRMFSRVAGSSPLVRLVT